MSDVIELDFRRRNRIGNVMLTGNSVGPVDRSQTFKLSNDPLFVDKVRDIVGLYLSPPNRALVLSIDEKSQIQALDREQPVLPMMPGVPERRTHSYVRHGTDFAVCRARCRVGVCHRQMLQAPPGSRVFEV